TWTEGSPDQWTWDAGNVINPAYLVHATTYTLRVRSRAQASPYQERTQNFTFFYDAVKPTATITSPANNYSTNTAINITGSSQDQGLLAQAATVFVSIGKDSADTGNNCYRRTDNTFAAACPNWLMTETDGSGWKATNISWSAGGVAARYFILARASDTANNVQDNFWVNDSSRSFVYDVEGPTAAITSPATGRNVSISTIAGTASSLDVAGVNLVQMRIKKVSEGKWWNGSNFTSGLTPEEAFFNVVPAAGPDWANWSVSCGVVNSGDKDFYVGLSTYEYSVRARDASGNWSLTYATYTTVWDNAAPETRLTLPSGGAFQAVSALSSIQGTMMDKTNASNQNLGTVTEVKVRFRRLDTGQYLDGDSSWQGSVQTLGQTTAGDDGPDGQVDFDAAGGTWAVKATILSAAQLPYGASYYITMSAQDNADSASNPNAANNIESFGVYSSTFVIDSSNPYTTITSPSHLAMLSELASITGTMSDDPILGEPAKVSAGIIKVEVQISTGVNDCWTGSAWTSCPYWINASTTTLQGPTSWISSGTWIIAASSLPVWQHNKTYWILVRSSDNAGNVENTFQTDVDSRSITFDFYGPTATVTNFTVSASTNFLPVSETSLIGISSDTPSSTGRILIAISSQTDGAGPSWYNGSSFSAPFSDAVYMSTSSWVDGPAGSTDSWTFNLYPPNIEDNYTYLLRIKTWDRAVVSSNTNVQNIKFRRPTPAPTAVIDVPQHNYSSATLINIMGTSTSAPGVSISTIVVSIQKLGTSFCYNGSNFSTASCPNWLAAAGVPESWNYNSVNWNPGFRYIITGRATDEAGNVQDSFAVGTSSNTFTYEINPPTAAITSPATGRTKILTTIAGTSADISPGSVAQVQLRIRRLSGTQNWWDGVNSFNPDTTEEGAFFNVVPDIPGNWTNWSASSGGLTGAGFKSGQQYQYSARARDNAGNWAITYSTWTTIWDELAPESRLVSPADGANQAVNSLTSIRGTMVDRTNTNPPDNINLSTNTSNVRVQLRRLDTGFYWNGDDWVAGYTLGSPAGPDSQVDFNAELGTWAVIAALPSGVKLPYGTSYYATSSAQDNADSGNNIESFGVYASTFVYDSSAPYTTIQSPSNNAMLSSLGSVTGTMADEPTLGEPAKVSAGINKVQVQISTSANACWTGSAWTSCPYWINASTTAVQGPTTWTSSGTWIIAASSLPVWLHDKTYWIVARSSDAAGSLEDTFTENIDSRTITFDLNAPTATVSNFVSTNILTGPFYVNPDFTVISGTITDTPADISTMTVALSSSPAGTGNTWWNGSAFTSSFGDGVYFATATWTEGSPDQWTWDAGNVINPAYLVHATTYTLRV
ncbi:MAG: hypothetical protein HY747_05855, partial [Elusimicrobia bacterium]|nr:hypothetical protein [Elusimicrobiota bacterium]